MRRLLLALAILATLALPALARRSCSSQCASGIDSIVVGCCAQYNGCQNPADAAYCTAFGHQVYCSCVTQCSNGQEMGLNCNDGGGVATGSTHVLSHR